MSVAKPLLLIPVENQVRELDPKLLLACVAARRGFSSVIGSRREMDMRIDSFPRSIYLSKSMTVRSLLFFWVAAKYGSIITWDEKHWYTCRRKYFSRPAASAIHYITHLFAGRNVIWRVSASPVGCPSLAPRRYAPAGDALLCHRGRAIRRARILSRQHQQYVNAFGPDIDLNGEKSRPDAQVIRAPEA
jgi:hypothetical protein